MSDVVYDIWLTLIDNVGPRKAAQLISHFGSAIDVYKSSYESLIAANVSETIAGTIVANKSGLLERAEMIVNRCEKTGLKVFVRGDVHYPRLLSETIDGPHVLYVRGNVNFNFGHFLSMVGTRDATMYGVNVCRKLVKQFKESVANPVTVSGLALGIDKIVHLASIEEGVPTVAVMPGWVDDVVPQSHYYLARAIIENGGAIVSDMPPGTIITKANFLSRNRIVAGMSQATVVVQSKVKGGSMVTADIASSYDRDVFTPIGDSTEYFMGNVELARTNKAIILQEFKEIAVELNWNLMPNKEKVNVDAIDSMLIEAFAKLPDDRKFCIDEAVELMNVSIAEGSRILTRLEICGLINSMHGRMYVKSN